MKRTLLIALLACTVLTCALSAQQWAQQRLEQSPRHRQIVLLHPGGRTLQAFIAYPEASGPRPVVLVIHEIFGLSAWAQEVTDELAAAGYVAIAPDLLSGQGPNGGGTASFPNQTAISRALVTMPLAEIAADLDAAADWALRQPASNGKLYVIGFCWGGTQSFRYATHRHDLRAALVFYGTPPGRAAMAQITAPVFGFYAGNDARVSLTVPGTRTLMAQLHKHYRAVIYKGAGHGFMRAGEQPGPTPANKAARTAAWKQIVRILR